MAVVRAGVSFLLTAAVLFLLLSAPSPARADDTPAVPMQGGADWPMYGASAAHNFSTGATPPMRLGLVWTLAGNATLGSAVVADGFAYAADVDAVRPPAGPNLVIHRVAAENGSALARDGAWTQRVLLANGIALAPSRSLAVSAGRVYALFTANVTSGDQEILASVDAATGSTGWTFNGTTRWTASAPNATRSAPVVAGGLVFFGSQDGNVYAVHASNGTLAWWFPTGAPVQTVPAVDGTIVYVTSGSKLFFLDIGGLANGDQGPPDSGHTGDELYEVNATAPITASPVVGDQYVYTDSAGTLAAFNKSYAGAPVWSAPIAGASDATPALWGGWIFARRSDGHVYAFSDSTGQVEWVVNGFSAPPGAGDMAVANGDIYLSARSGSTYDLVTLDATSGSVVDRNTTTSRPALGAPVAAGDLVYVAEGSRLLAFRGQPDLTAVVSDQVLNAATGADGQVRGNLTITVRNEGVENASSVRVTVKDGGTVIANLTLGEPKPIKAGGRAQAYTPTQTWAGGRHEITITIRRVPTESNEGNNELTFAVDVVAGPPPAPVVVGAGPYWAALLLGFGVGAAVVYLPLRRLRDTRRKQAEPESPLPHGRV